MTESVAETGTTGVRTGTKSVSELTIVNYSAMYLPISMALLPVGVYVQPHYAELGITLYAMSVVIFLARCSDVVTDPLINVEACFIFEVVIEREILFRLLFRHFLFIRRVLHFFFGHNGSPYRRAHKGGGS